MSRTADKPPRCIDPPEGSTYGLQKRVELSVRNGVDIDAWLLANGYPQAEIDNRKSDGRPCHISSGLPVSGVDLSDLPPDVPLVPLDQTDFDLDEGASEAFADALTSSTETVPALRELMRHDR